jgi:hypothetical protein
MIANKIRRIGKNRKIDRLGALGGSLFRLAAQRLVDQEPMATLVSEVMMIEAKH